jgi:hypothetical protein
MFQEMSQLRTRLALLTGLIVFLIPLVSSADFCWKDTKTRSSGAIPSACEAGKEMENGLCYSKCPAGYEGEGPACWKSCPKGYTDSGIACTKSKSYGRGAGFPWKLGDTVGSLDEARARCRAANPQGCEKSGEIIYPKCREGYKAIGSNICSQVCPTGYDDTGATCLKPNTTRGAGLIPKCPGNKVNDKGLCYDPCPSGFEGKGPVCWQTCPKSVPYECGAGCTSTNYKAPSRSVMGRDNECNRVVAEQVMSVLQVAENIALTIASGGTAIVAKNIAKDAASDVVIKASKSEIRNAIVDAAKDAGQSLGEEQVKNLVNMASGEDFDPTSFDPTGISAIVNAYDHNTCPMS